MASLDPLDRRALKKRRVKLFLVCIILLTPLCVFCSIFLNRCLLTQTFSPHMDWGAELQHFFAFHDARLYLLWLCIEIVLIVGLYQMIFLQASPIISESREQQLTDNISIPVAVGNGQYGNERFLTEEEKKAIPEFAVYIPGKTKPKGKGGIVLQMMINSAGKEEILYMPEDIHTILIGATRSGKSRRVMLQSIWLISLYGESMVITDPKGELHAYTRTYLEQKGYNVIDFDLCRPNCGKHYNYMQPILDALAEGDTSTAVDYTWDLVAVLVGEAKGEPLWSNGESATIAAGIMIVAMDAPPEYKNLANVYYFLAYMCELNEDGDMPINDYLDDLDDSHPAKGVFAMARIAQGRTRSSFFTSALGTLKLFTNWNVAEVTSKSDFTLEEIVQKKSVLFIIVPDEKKTLYPLASLLVNQLYVAHAKEARKHGSRVVVDCNYLLDEFGNFPTIPSFDSMLSVGAGRGLRFMLVLQSYQQLEEHYEKTFKTIKDNCQNIVYLKSPSEETVKEISEMLGSYTIQTSSVSGNSGKNPGDSTYSDSAQQAKRELLTPAEVGRIQSPYSLCRLIGNFPAIMKSPDISQYHANKELGLGDKEHNQKLIMDFEARREERQIKEPALWGIWKRYAFTAVKQSKQASQPLGALFDEPFDTGNPPEDTGSESLTFLDLR